DQCSNSISCVQKITVRDITKPTITCPPDLVLDCPADTTTNATGVATAQDTCSAVTIRYADAVTNKCGATKVIARTWTATDGCSNSVSCVQMITVRHITGPSIICPPDIVLECPAITTTNATGVATAQDGCGSVVSLSYSDLVTAGCGNSKVISRTWTAIDQCGNSGSAVQTITVADTTPPTITCPANRVLECTASIDPANTGVATGQDTCGLVAITFADVVTANGGGRKTISRT